jgi:uncharacterized membrane protein
MPKLSATAITFFPPRESASQLTWLSGRILLALPMLIYPFFHFIDLPCVEAIVPPWIPWHALWTCFTAITIFAAGISILAGRYTKLAVTLLGIEILLFCLLIHLFLLLRLHGDAWASSAMFGDLPSRLMNAPKDLGMAGACFILAGSLRGDTEHRRGNWLLIAGQAIFSVSIIALGALHFFYPDFAPGVEPMQASIAFLLPGSRFFAYLTGIEFIVIIGCITMKKHARLAAVILGFTILIFDVLVWGPRLIHNPMEMFGPWLKDIGLAGDAFLLADAQCRASNESVDSSVAAD